MDRHKKKRGGTIGFSFCWVFPDVDTPSQDTIDISCVLLVCSLLQVHK